MRDMQNLPSVRPAFILVPHATNPIPLGSAGFWYDGATLSIVAADGTVEVLTSTGMLDPVRLATAAALPSSTYSSATQKITGAAPGALTVDGALVANSDRILVKNEAGSINGVYNVTQKGTGSLAFVLTRAPDFNASAEIRPGIRVATGPDGSANLNTEYKLTSAAPIVLDTTAITFA